MTTDTLKKSNSKRNISAVSIMLGTIVIFALCMFYLKLVVLAPDSINKIASTEIEVEQNFNNRVSIIKNYIKQRNNTISIEVCNIIAEKIIILCDQEQLPPDLIVAMIETESTWNPTVTSSEGAKGLMQILKEDGIDIEYSKSYDIEYNIKTGIDILKSKLNKADGSLTKALKMYVGGQKNYSEKVYQAIGLFVMYKANIIIEEREKEEK